MMYSNIGLSFRETVPLSQIKNFFKSSLREMVHFILELDPDLDPDPHWKKYLDSDPHEMLRIRNTGNRRQQVPKYW